MTDHRLALIGGGASAALLLAHLARAPISKNWHIDVYDRAGAFAKGIAYSTPHLCHLLNVRASNMSALANEPDNFAQWAASKNYTASDFVPRKLYGDYLSEHVQFAQSILSTTLIPEDVLGSARMADGTYQIKTTADTRAYDIVINATGNCVPLRPKTNGAVDRYYESPWPIDYASLAHHQHIALIGSGLSAVDAVLALQAHEYTGDITIVSRNGLLPATHVHADAYPAFLNALPQTALQAFALIRREIKKADAPWQAIIDSLRPFTNRLWELWTESERARFMKRLLTQWNVHRHRMAPQIADTITALETSGRLHRVKAAVQRVSPGPVLETDQDLIQADAIINCLGYRYNERPLQSTYQIGPANFGALFETTAIPEIRAQAAQIAAKIAA